GPSSNLINIDLVFLRHKGSLQKRLMITPVIIGCQSVLDTISRRDNFQNTGRKLFLDRLLNVFLSNRKWPGREFNKELRVRMPEISSFFIKTQHKHGVMDFSSVYSVYIDEIPIF